MALFGTMYEKLTGIQIYIIFSLLSFTIGSILSLYFSSIISYKDTGSLKQLEALFFVFLFYYFIPFSYLRKRYIRKTTPNEYQKSNLFAFGVAFGFASLFFITTFCGNIFEFDFEIFSIILVLLIIGYFSNEMMNSIPLQKFRHKKRT